MRKVSVTLAVLLAFVLGVTCQARAGGVLKIALTSNLNTLDPAKSKSGDEYLYMFMVFNALTMIDRDLNLKPDLPKAGKAATTSRPGRSTCARESSSTMGVNWMPKTSSRPSTGSSTRKSGPGPGSITS